MFRAETDQVAVRMVRGDVVPVALIRCEFEGWYDTRVLDPGWDVPMVLPGGDLGRVLEEYAPVFKGERLVRIVI